MPYSAVCAYSPINTAIHRYTLYSPMQHPSVICPPELHDEFCFAKDVPVKSARGRHRKAPLRGGSLPYSRSTAFVHARNRKGTTYLIYHSVAPHTDQSRCARWCNSATGESSPIKSSMSPSGSSASVESASPAMLSAEARVRTPADARDGDDQLGISSAPRCTLSSYDRSSASTGACSSQARFLRSRTTAQSSP